jgi:CheY-like chemotaxis protein
MQITLAPHSINQVVDDMYAIYYQIKEQTNKNIRLAIHKDLPDNMCHVLIDDLRIKQILTNLIDNAFKFTLKGHIIFGYRIKMNTFEFFVEDTGMGIPGSQHEIIFKPFIQADQTTTRKYSGTGLGLAIAQGLVSLFNGRLWIESIPDKGTTFYFTIPYVPCEIDHASQNSFNIPKELRWNDKLILIVEDEHFNAEYLRSLLAPTGINMILAVNGYQAIDKCLSNPSIDLVLMDIRLPDIDGLKATEEIRKINKEVPIVALTAYASPEDKKKCLDGGCNDYVTKPVNSKDLLAVVRSFI